MTQQRKRALEVDFAATQDGDLTPTAEAIQDIIRLRSSAVSYIRSTNEKIDNRLRGIYIPEDLEEVIFVSRVDKSIVCLLTNVDNKVNIKFVPNEAGLGPGILGFRLKGEH